MRRKKTLWFNVCAANLHALRQLLLSAKLILLREIRKDDAPAGSHAEGLQLERALALLTFDWVPRWIAVRLQQEVIRHNQTVKKCNFDPCDAQGQSKFNSKSSLYRDRFMRRFKASPISSSSIVENWHACSPRRRNIKRDRGNSMDNSIPAIDLQDSVVDEPLNETLTLREDTDPFDVPSDMADKSAHSIFMTFRADLIDGREWSMEQLQNLCDTLGLPTDGDRTILANRISSVHDDAPLLLRSISGGEASAHDHHEIQQNIARESTIKRRKKIVFSPFVQMKTIPCRERSEGDMEEKIVIPPTA